ncbi:hypothetical protein OMY_00814 [Enterococcus sulfureus ATCC 49903]|uniref:Uncharacterized protein n=1 Tax=Enterococcus sulfureus ATCC 49903 TaxID=1140003 RepID=S0NRM1_9ENTE|nr:hypothetical protein OMY_00814 [Enterococcus sulfureus ATCC 49903]EOT84137.1 hypothetical protein I573_01864 [Enterococcus sulfureus ATCC 49903]
MLIILITGERLPHVFQVTKKDVPIGTSFFYLEDPFSTI